MPKEHFNSIKEVFQDYSIDQLRNIMEVYDDGSLLLSGILYYIESKQL